MKNLIFKNKKTLNSGFTLLEILLVVGIISILAGIVIVAINPGRQLALARNTERRSDLKQINSALQQYYIDHREYPAGLTDELVDICDTGNTASSSVDDVFGVGYCDDLVNLSVLVPTYLTAIPKDPQASTTASTGYKVKKHSSGKIGLSAPAELNQTIAINVPSEEEVTTDICEVSGDATDPGCWSVADMGFTTYPDCLEAYNEYYYGGFEYGCFTWGPGVISGVSTSTTLSNGKANTDILAGLAGDYPAADYCVSLTEDGVPAGTWYLPSYAELFAGEESGVGGFTNRFYWSSTEHLVNPTWMSWYLNTGEGDGMSYDVKSVNISVRCLR